MGSVRYLFGTRLKILHSWSRRGTFTSCTIDRRSAPRDVHRAGIIVSDLPSLTSSQARVVNSRKREIMRHSPLGPSFDLALVRRLGPGPNPSRAST